MNRTMRPYSSLLAVFICLLALSAGAAEQRNNGFEKIFDGKSLNGWKIVGDENGYVVKDGLLVCPEGSGSNIFTEKEFTDYVLRFEFRMAKGANNGVGIRSPLEGDSAYLGIECQILDDEDESYKGLQPWQYHGSLYNIVPAKHGFRKPVGSWNSEEISVIGRKMKVTVNGHEIVNADLNTITDPVTLGHHPGMLRERGHIGFLGHPPTEVSFRNIYVKDLGKPQADNTAPTGFKRLFNGKDLTGWKGLVDDPPTRAKMTPAQLTAATEKATAEAVKHWKVINGEIVYDGKNNSLCTTKDYGDFEMMVDWKIEAGGDSGIYLRGSPQVQIWDNPLGSGGLYNNQKGAHDPLVVADKPIGEWNHFRILMVGDRVTVYLNDTLVVNNVVMENYWERDKPIYPIGQIELQHHGSILHFKNIYIREIPRKAK